MASQSVSQTKPLRVALIGADTLLGRDIREVLEERAPGTSITSFAANAEGGFGEEEGEAVFVQPFTADAVSRHDAVILAGTEEGAQRAYASASGSSALIVDCLGYLESFKPDALGAPLLQSPPLTEGNLIVLAHPAAAALGLVFMRLARRTRIEAAVANVFEPASERGKRGLNELHQQTASLLSFKALDKQVFDAQLSFNLLSKYGEDAPVQLLTVEERISRQVGALLEQHAETVPKPSVRVVQAPVFHGYSISLWLRFAEHMGAEAIAGALASAQIDVRTHDQEPPTNVESAGQSGLVAGDIRLDKNHTRAAWVWITGDNLRLTADACADVLAEWRNQPK